MERRAVLSGMVGVTGPTAVDEGEYAYFDFENSDPFSDEVTVFYRTVAGSAIGRR